MILRVKSLILLIFSQFLAPTSTLRHANKSKHYTNIKMRPQRNTLVNTSLPMSGTNITTVLNGDILPPISALYLKQMTITLLGQH